MSDLLKEVKDALAKATPGPWVNGPGCIYVPNDTPIKRKVIGVINKTENAELCSNAPQWLASLVALAEQRQADALEIGRNWQNDRHELFKALAEKDQQIEEMQKTLEWYAKPGLHKYDEGERAWQTLQSIKEAK